MPKKHYPTKTEHKKTIDTMFIVMICILVLATVYASIYVKDFVKDCIAGFIVVGIFYFVQRDYHVPPSIIIMGFIPIVLHLSGVLFHFYEYLIQGIGYDKYIHFANCMFLTIVVFYILIAHAKKEPIKKAITAFLFVLGIGAVAKNMEFFGSQYIHFTGSTMLSEGDFTLQTTSQVLQKLQVSQNLERDMINYDYQWDMLCNTFGAIIGLVIIWILWAVDKRNLKDRIYVHER